MRSERRRRRTPQPEVARILRRARRRTSIPSRSLSELGVDSVGYCTVSAFVEKQFGIAVPPETLFEFSSVQATAAHVAQLTRGAGQPLRAVEQPCCPLRAPCRSAAPLRRLMRRTPRGTSPSSALRASFRERTTRTSTWDLIRGGTSVIREFPAAPRSGSRGRQSRLSQGRLRRRRGRLRRRLLRHFAARSAGDGPAAAPLSRVRLADVRERRVHHGAVVGIEHRRVRRGLELRLLRIAVAHTGCSHHPYRFRA